MEGIDLGTGSNSGEADERRGGCRVASSTTAPHFRPLGNPYFEQLIPTAFNVFHAQVRSCASNSDSYYADTSFLKRADFTTKQSLRLWKPCEEGKEGHKNSSRLNNVEIEGIGNKYRKKWGCKKMPEEWTLDDELCMAGC